MTSIFTVQTQSRIDFTDFKQLKLNISLEDLFKQIFDIVKSQLDNIMKEEGNDDKFINQKEYVNEFASADYLDKNIWVRPPTGQEE